MTTSVTVNLNHIFIAHPDLGWCAIITCHCRKFSLFDKREAFYSWPGLSIVEGLFI